MRARGATVASSGVPFSCPDAVHPAGGEVERPVDVLAPPRDVRHDPRHLAAALLRQKRHDSVAARRRLANERCVPSSRLNLGNGGLEPGLCPARLSASARHQRRPPRERAEKQHAQPGLSHTPLDTDRAGKTIGTSGCCARARASASLTEGVQAGILDVEQGRFADGRGAVRAVTSGARVLPRACPGWESAAGTSARIRRSACTGRRRVPRP